MVRAKICCISSLAEAGLAIQAGASALGFVSEMPSGPGVISEEDIAKIVAELPPLVATVLLTSKTTAEGIIAQQKFCRTNTIQICDRVAPAVYSELKEALPGVALVQVVHVQNEESVQEALLAAEKVDALLLDSGNQKLPVKELGGTGRTHDWTLSARIVQESPKPVLLAGGLNPSNVAEAIRTVKPYAVDVCSGVRRNDQLDEELLKGFMARVMA